MPLPLADFLRLLAPSAPRLVGIARLAALGESIAEGHEVEYFTLPARSLLPEIVIPSKRKPSLRGERDARDLQSWYTSADPSLALLHSVPSRFVRYDNSFGADCGAAEAAPFRKIGIPPASPRLFGIARLAALGESIIIPPLRGEGRPATSSRRSSRP